jgi:hypothetical protein
LGDSLAGLREGRPVYSLYESTFLINWPAHLGGGSSEITLRGSMVLLPLMGTQ